MRNSALVLTFFLATSFVGTARCEPAATPVLAPAPALAPANPNVVGQAAEATVGRVFGVEGDAADIKYHTIEFTKHSPAGAATRSLLIPGWGQSFNRQRTKGAIFFLTTVGFAFASAKVYSHAVDSYDTYVENGVKDSSHYDDYKRDRDRAVILGSTAALLWAISIFDAYRNAYKPLYSQSTGVDLVLLDEGGAQMRFKKGF